jgi:hypothetical protein
MMVEAELISRAGAAAKLGVSVRTVDRLRADGVLETRRVRGRRMVTLASYERYLGRKSEAGGEVAKAARNWDGFVLPALDNELERRRNEREQREAA